MGAGRHDDKFVDPTLPADYAPYGIQTIGTRIFVTYASRRRRATREIPGAGQGLRQRVRLRGQLPRARRVAAACSTRRGASRKADPNFGAFGGDLLIGNFGDGRINAFHENADGTWTPSGTLKGLNGQPLSIGGLWAIQFGSGAANNGQRNHLYFTAGPNGETGGPVRPHHPEPGRGGGTVPATLVADARHAGELRRLHAGRRQGLHGLDDRHRDLHAPVTRR